MNNISIGSDNIVADIIVFTAPIPQMVFFDQVEEPPQKPTKQPFQPPKTNRLKERMKKMKKKRKYSSVSLLFCNFVPISHHIGNVLETWAVDAISFLFVESRTRFCNIY